MDKTEFRKQIFEQYKKLLAFFAAIIGPDYEISLYDLTKPQKSIIAIINNHISGRNIGAPLTEWATKLIAEKQYLHNDYIAAYNALGRDNKLIRSSILFIMDDNELIGLLCINFDSSRHLQISKDILRLCHPDALVERNYNFTPNTAQLNIYENFSGTLIELVDMTLQEYFKGSAIPPEHISKKERTDIVARLKNQGVFMLKGAIALVAKRLGCSEPTIYRYLGQTGSCCLPANTEVLKKG